VIKYTILTIFPNLFNDFVNESIVKRAIKKKAIKIDIVDFRNFSKEKTKRVDDYQIGPGSGMVLTLQPIVDAIKKYRTKNSKVILLSPQGKKYNQVVARQLSKQQHLILICGRYEGFDERIVNYIDEIISLGDFVLNGGEIAAMAIIESSSRLISGVINSDSLIDESFNNNLLDYPTYTKPYNFEGHKVPEILTSGNHQKINKFRKDEQIKKTKLLRPDLLK
jgi:tRNA (guanine37-N1)-methyltransferase